MLHLAIARRAFRRYSTYRAATLAGIFTNSVFGVIYCFVYLALWEQRPGAGGYDGTDAVTYVWLGQGLLAAVAMWGGGATNDLADRIRSGDVAIDLYRPVGVLGWYLASDFGRWLFHLLTRGVGPLVVGALLFDLHWPGGPAAWTGFLAALPLALVVSYGVRFLVACTAFWLLDATGPTVLATILAIFFSGLALPLVIFPDGLRELAMALPWAAFLQVPADIWLGHRSGAGILTGLAFQAAWAVALLVVCAGVLRLATRKVVVQGG